MTIRPENLPEHQVHIDNLADVVDLARRARAHGIPAEVATKLPTFVLAEQLGVEHGLSEHTEVRLRKALRLVLADGVGGPTGGSKGARRRRSVGTRPIGG